MVAMAQGFEVDTVSDEFGEGIIGGSENRRAGLRVSCDAHFGVTIV